MKGDLKMNIEVNDVDIQKIVEKQVADRLRSWFKERDLSRIINEAIKDVVSVEVNQRFDFTFEKIINNITKKDILDRVANQISSDIASAYADRYGDY